jgi:hypothetical protein
MSHTKESLSKLTNPELYLLLKSMKEKKQIDAKVSGLKHDEMVALILNPSSGGSAKKSPGRPKGIKNKSVVGNKSKDVNYTGEGLNDLTLAMLKELAKAKNISGLSAKNKDEVIALLLQHPHTGSLSVSVAGKTSTTTANVHPTSASRVAVAPIQTAATTSPKKQSAQSSAAPEQKVVIGGSILDVASANAALARTSPRSGNQMSPRSMAQAGIRY